MKKILHLAWLLLLFTACQQDDTDIAPEEKPDARLNKVLSDYKTQLSGSEYGWKAILQTQPGEVYSFLLKFTPNDRVTMTSDINASTTTPLESSYRLKAMQKPSLLFDTYSHLHVLADPDPNKNGGDVGQGRYGDFEFYFESATAETITLKGQFQGSKLVLTKATQAEATSYNTNVAAYVGAVESLKSFTTYFKRLTLGAKAYDIQVNTSARTISFTTFAGETAGLFTTGYYYSADGLVLLQPFNAEGVTISVLQGLQFNSGSRQLNFTVNNAAATVQEAARPVKVDVQGARNFFNASTGDNYWQSDGFTVDGVPDALQLSSLPNFYFLALWPKFGTSSNVTYDLLGFVKLNAAGTGLELAYGPAATSRVTTDGRLVYSLLGNLGEVPTGDSTAVTATQQIWTDTQGFFVVRTGDNSVDLVRARDGKAWLPLTQ